MGGTLKWSKIRLSMTILLFKPIVLGSPILGNRHVASAFDPFSCETLKSSQMDLRSAVLMTGTKRIKPYPNGKTPSTLSTLGSWKERKIICEDPTLTRFASCFRGLVIAHTGTCNRILFPGASVLTLNLQFDVISCLLYRMTEYWTPQPLFK